MTSRTDEIRIGATGSGGGAPGRLAARRRPPRWLPLPLGIGIGLAGGLCYGVAAPPQYAATSYVIVVPARTGDPGTPLGFAQAYGRVVTGSAVLAGAQASTGIASSDLRGKVAAETSPDAPMIAVTGTDGEARAAAGIANAVARSLAATGNRAAAGTGVRLLVFSPAATPTSPSSPSTTLCAAVGASAGGLLGALALLVRPREEHGPATPAVPAQPHAPTGAPV